MKMTWRSAKIALALAVLLAGTLLPGCGKESAAPGPSKPDAASPPAAVQPEQSGKSYGQYLTAADVEKVSGLGGLKVTDENRALKFTDSAGTVVYEAKFYDSAFYEDEVGGNRKYYTDVSGVGDKAAICIPDSPYRLTFAKGQSSVMTQVLGKDDKGKWLLTEEQLIALAQVIASRM